MGSLKMGFESILSKNKKITKMIEIKKALE
jgi:hypothetical protein